MITKNIKNTNTVEVIPKSKIINNSQKVGIPFKILPKGEYHLNKITFAHLIKKTFFHLQDPGSKHYLGNNQWLFLAFKKIFQKNPLLLQHIHKIVNDFYKIYPFNLEEIFSHLVSKFFKKFPFNETITNNFENLKIVSENGIKTLAKKIFNQFFIKYIEENLQIDKLTTNYKSLKNFFQVALKKEITKILQTKITNFNWKDYNHLNNWINKFDYRSTNTINFASIYDQFFGNSNNLQKIDLKENHFFNNYLINYLQKNLNFQKKVSINGQIPMLAQAFLYYLFIDLLANKQIKPVKVWSLEEAKKVIDLLKNMRNGALNKINDNVFLFAKIVNFFPSLWNFINKFNFKLKTNSINLTNLPNWIRNNRNLRWLNNNFGISVSNVSLLPLAGSQTQFNLQLQLKFTTPAISQVNNQLSYTFTIKVINTENDFQKAVQITKDFFNKNHMSLRKSYFLNAPSITEKDLVERTSNINSYQDILGSHKDSTERRFSSNNFEELVIGDANNHTFWLSFYSSLNDNWNNIFLEDISELNKKLALINNDYYSFKLKLVYDLSGEHSYNKKVSKLNSLIYYWVFLIQEPKGLNFSLKKRFGYYRTNLYNFKWQKIYIKWKSLSTKNYRYYQKLLMANDLIKHYVKKKFPQGLTFDPWKVQSKPFWKEEFLDKNDNPVKFDNLKTKNDLLKRSNLLAIKNYLKPIIAKINQYRNEITYKEYYVVYKDKKTKQWILKLSFIIRDEGTDQEFVLSAQVRLMSLENYKNNDFFEFFKFSQPLSKLTDQQKNQNAKVQDSFTFLYKGKKISLANLKARFKKYGTRRFIWTKAHKEGFKDTYLYKIIVTIDLPYHNFFSGKKEYHKMVFDLYLEPHNLPISPSRIDNKYKEIITNLKPEQSNNTHFMKAINNLFDKLRVPNKKDQWRNDVKKKEFFNIISQIREMISKFQNKNVMEIIIKLQKIYGSNIPNDVLKKAFNPEYYEIFKEILDQSNKIGHNNIKNILENSKFIDFLKKQKINKIRSFVLDFLKTSEKTKYVYFGVGVGFGAVGLLAAGTSIWWKRVNKYSKIVNVKFKKNKYLLIMTLSLSLVSIITSVIFMILFLINKGGF